MRRFGQRPCNGTEGDHQRAQTCNRCVKDHGWHDGEPADMQSCPIILDALAGEHSYPNPDGPPQWWHDMETGEWGCTEFEPCECAS